MSVLKKFLIVLVAGSIAVAMGAQTPTLVPITQVKSSVPGLPTGTLLMVLPTGQFALIDLSGSCWTFFPATPPAHGTLAFNAAGAGCATASAAPVFVDDLPFSGTATCGTLPACITGVVDGVNTVFTLPSGSTVKGLKIFRNGIKLTAASDFTLSGLVVTFLAGAVPTAGDIPNLNASWHN